VVTFLPKAFAVTAAGVLFFGMFLAYDFVGLSGSNGPSETVLWTILGAGFALALGGTIASSLQLSKPERRTLAMSLFGFGFVSFALAMFVAHIGPVLFVLAVPALLLSATVGIMALPFPPLSSSHRDDKSAG
jgi:hypothetical protein